MADGIMEPRTARVSAEEALALHSSGRPGKLETRISKPLITTARDLSAWRTPQASPNPACTSHRRPRQLAYEYTTKGNMVAVDLATAPPCWVLAIWARSPSKPVMEGKVALFKRFADVDGIDLEIVHRGRRRIRQLPSASLGAGFGGINLEDIKAPECFVIEQRLRELMDIPVFHDDQHGTAIVAAAGLINACHLTSRALRGNQAGRERCRRGGDCLCRAAEGHGRCGPIT